MPKGLTYLSSKCVLQYLEANRRIRIAALCPTLRKTERSLPLQIDNLVFKDQEITLNNITYGVQTLIKDTPGGDEQKILCAIDKYGNRDKSADKLVLPGDIFFKTSREFGREEELNENVPERASTRPLYSRYIEITCEYKQMIYKKRVPNNLEFHLVLKHLSSFLLKNRRDIRVNRLKVDLKHQKILRLPKSLEMTVNHFDTGVHCPVLMMSILNDAKRFPPREHKIDLGNRRTFITYLNTKKLIIIDYDNNSNLPSWPVLFPMMLYKNIVLKSSRLSKNDIIDIVQDWISNPDEIGKCYMLEINEVMIFLLLDEIKRRFNGVDVNLKKPDERQLVSLSCLSIPINQRSELCVYGIMDLSDGSLQLKMEILSIGSTIPVVMNNFLPTPFVYPPPFPIFYPPTFPIFYPLPFPIFHVPVPIYAPFQYY